MLAMRGNRTRVQSRASSSAANNWVEAEVPGAEAWLLHRRRLRPPLPDFCFRRRPITTARPTSRRPGPAGRRDSDCPEAAVRAVPARLLLLCLLLRSSWANGGGRRRSRLRTLPRRPRRSVSTARCPRPAVYVPCGLSGGIRSERQRRRVAVPSQQWGAACWVCAAAALALSGWSRMPSSIGGCAGRGRRPRCGWLRLSWRGFA